MSEREPSRQPSVEALEAAVLAGSLSRRAVLKRGVTLGLSAPVIAGLLAACGGSDDDNTPAATTAPTDVSDGGAATEATGDSTPEGSETATEPAGDSSPESSGGRGRGEGDLLRILYWQAPPMLNPHFANGNLISAPAAIVLEPIVRVTPAGEIVPV